MLSLLNVDGALVIGSSLSGTPTLLEFLVHIAHITFAVWSGIEAFPLDISRHSHDPHGLRTIWRLVVAHD